MMRASDPPDMADPSRNDLKREKGATSPPVFPRLAVEAGGFQRSFRSGLVTVQRAKYPDAVEWLARAASLQPKSAPCVLHHGVALAKPGHHAQAETALRKAVKLETNNPEACDALGYVLKVVGRIGGSLAADRRAVDCDLRRAAVGRPERITRDWTNMCNVRLASRATLKRAKTYVVDFATRSSAEPAAHVSEGRFFPRLALGALHVCEEIS